MQGFFGKLRMTEEGATAGGHSPPLPNPDGGMKAAIQTPLTRHAKSCHPLPSERANII